MSLNLQDLILQIPLVILIIYVIELRDKRWQEMMRQRDEQWQKFFEVQDEQHRESMAEVVIALRESTLQANKTHELMMIHDQRVVSAIPMMQKMQSEARGDKP